MKLVLIPSACARGDNKKRLGRQEKWLGGHPYFVLPSGSEASPHHPVFLSVREKSPSCGRERLKGATPHFVRGDNKKEFRGDRKRGRGDRKGGRGVIPTRSFRAEREISTSKSNLQGE